jgi:hypothetical protein
VITKKMARSEKGMGANQNTSFRVSLTQSKALSAVCKIE